MGCLSSSGGFAAPALPFVQKKSRIVWKQENETFALQRCGSCGHLFFENVSETDLSRYFAEEYHRRHAAWYSAVGMHSLGFWEEVGRDALARMAAVKPGRVSVHEVSCGFGGLVHWLNAKGMDATGCDERAFEIGEGRKNGNIRVFTADDPSLEEIRANPPDFVLSYHSLQRRAAPQTEVARLKQYFGSHTIGIVYVPSALYARAMLESIWAHPWFSYPDNPHLFSPSSLSCALRAGGFAVFDVGSTKRDQDRPALAAAWRRLQGRDDIDEGEATRLTHELGLGMEIFACFCLPDGDAARQHAEAIAGLEQDLPRQRDREVQAWRLLGGIS